MLDVSYFCKVLVIPTLIFTRPFQDEHRGLSGFGTEAAAATAASFFIIAITLAEEVE